MPKIYILLIIFLLHSCTNQSINADDEYFKLDFNPFIELEILNYTNNFQNTHPKILFFPDSLFGYKYWMTYTPYPDGNIEFENVCLAVSNNGYFWTHINDSKPLVPQYKFGYNSDPHLLYRTDLNQLELWYRPYNISTLKSKIVRCVSTDGVNWSKEQTIWDFDDSQKLSPAILFEDDKYKMWYCDNNLIKFRESVDNDIDKWTSSSTVPVYVKRVNFWHLDVISDSNGKYEFLVCGYNINSNSNSADLYYFSQNINTYTTPHLIAHKFLNNSRYKGLYRSSFFKDGDYYYLYGSSIDFSWQRHLFISVLDRDLKFIKIQQ